jgi:alkylation response protein AidB-like acyl-CoA dehydrogenase
VARLAPSAAQARVQREVEALLARECPLARVRSAEPLGFDRALWDGLRASEACTPEADPVALALAAEACGGALAPVPFAEHVAASRLLARAGAPAVGPLVTLALRPAANGVVRLAPAGAVAPTLIALDRGALVVEASAPPRSGPRNLGSLPLADRSLDAGERRSLASGAEAELLHAEALAEWQWLTAAALVGLGERVLALTLAHVKQRVQFGVPIGSFQALQHRLADRATELVGARLLALRAAWAGGRGAPDRLAWASAAFLFASGCARAATAAALQLHGGRGYTLEHEVPLFHRRARGWPLVLGDAAAEWERLGALRYGGMEPPPRVPGAEDPEGLDFGLGPRAEDFRAEVRAFLAEHLTREVEERTRRTGTMHDWGFHRALAARGWIGASWPRSEGGQGRDPFEMRVLAEECARREAPTDALLTTWMVAGALRAVGSEETKRSVLPRILAGKCVICLGYSEPEAGSDLANVRTRAVRDGDAWVIDGEKAFTSNAHVAEYVFLLARTNPGAPRHRGLTMFLVPMATAGIAVEAVPTLGAPGRTNRTLYREVRVADGCRVGEVDGGWAVVNAALALERGGMFGALRSLDRAEHWARERGRLGEPVLRARLARVWVENEVASLLGLAVACASARGEPTGIASAMSKLYATESTQRSCDELLELLGNEGVLPEGERDAPAGGAVEFEWRKAGVGTIYAGTSEVMRGLIAELHLGLPRSRPPR